MPLEPALVPTWAFYAVPWAAGLALGLAVYGARLRPAVGLALMTVPLWETLLGIADSFETLVAGGVTLRAYTTHELSRLYSVKIVSDLGYVGAGVLLWCSEDGGLLGQTPRRIARRLSLAGLPMGRRGEGASALVGYVAFPVLLGATLAASWFLGQFDSLQQSDESSVFDNMTPYHAVLISLAAAFGEEAVYRGVLLVLLLAAGTWLARAMGHGEGRVAQVAVGSGAVAVQAVVFGFAHSGYATWIHVLLPTLFGLVAGVAAWRFGIWSAIVLHALVDLYAFGAETASSQPWLINTLGALLLVNVAVAVGWAVWKAAGVGVARQAPPAPP
jgi:hypothetical protein